MSRRFSRRYFAQASMVLPIALIGDIASARQVTSVGPLTAAIGSTRAAFDTDYGASRQEAEFTVYDHSHMQQASYWVRFDANGHADYIEIDFTALPDGGLPFATEALGASRFVPADAVDYGAVGRGGHKQIPRSSFNTKQYRSDQLAQVTGRSRNLIVVDEIQNMANGFNVPSPILRTFVALETNEVHSVLGTGTNPGIGGNQRTWEEVYGRIQGAQLGYYLETPPVPGSWTLDIQAGRDLVGGIDISFDTPVSPADSAELLSGMLAAGQEPMASYWMPPSPNGGIGLRVHVFNTYRYEYATSIQYVHGGEQSGWVDRLMCFASWVYPHF